MRGDQEDMRRVRPTRRLAQGYVRDSMPSIGGHGGFTLLADPSDTQIDRTAAIVQDVHTVWDMKRFQEPRAPLIVGKVADSSTFSDGANVHICDLPIKFPGSAYLVPMELDPFRSVIQACIDFEAGLNPHIAEYYAYLTLQRSVVAPGEASRGTGPHTDSVQGRRILPKRPIEHGYACVDRDPTVYFTHGFDMSGVDEHLDYLPAVFLSQVDSNRTYRPKPYEVLFFDAYCVHSAVPSLTGGRRTFFRLILSLRPFDRAGNTRNEMFDYDWQMVPRPLPLGLTGADYDNSQG